MGGRGSGVAVGGRRVRKRERNKGRKRVKKEKKRKKDSSYNGKIELDQDYKNYYQI